MSGALRPWTRYESIPESFAINSPARSWSLSTCNESTYDEAQGDRMRDIARSGDDFAELTPQAYAIGGLSR